MDAPEDDAFLDYRARWHARDARPGKHPARQSGRDGDFRAYRPFWQLPDAQRIDVRRSIMDPWSGVVVRQMAQRSAITLMLVVDVSRSMTPGNGRSHLPCVARLVEAAARSAVRAGDAVGILAFEDALRDDLCVAPTRRRNVLMDFAARLPGIAACGGSAGLEATRGHLPAQRCLVLLVSDFLMPLQRIEAVLVAMARHDVALVVLDGAQAVPGMGLLRLQDAETGAARLLFIRPALQRRWRSEIAARRERLDLLFEQYGRKAFHSAGGLDIAGLSRHLAGP
jgi:uncharacterized protein (DUF58 family)